MRQGQRLACRQILILVAVAGFQFLGGGLLIRKDVGVHDNGGYQPSTDRIDLTTTTSAAEVVLKIGDENAGAAIPNNVGCTRQVDRA